MANGLDPTSITIDEAAEIDTSIFDEVLAPTDAAVDAAKAHRAFIDTIVRLERLVASPFCTMTGRAGVYRREVKVAYGSGYPPVKVTAKFSNYEVAQEAREWGAFLVQAIQVGHRTRSGEVVALPFAESVSRGYVRAPLPRSFSNVGTFPGVAAKPEPKRRPKGARYALRHP